MFDSDMQVSAWQYTAPSLAEQAAMHEADAGRCGTEEMGCGQAGQGLVISLIQNAPRQG